MTEQNCPLCGEKLKHSMDFIGDRYYCLNTNCMDIIMRKSDLNKLISQISRIKQQAYEEGKKSIQENKDTVYRDNWIIIKKKHGVE